MNRNDFNRGILSEYTKVVDNKTVVQEAAPNFGRLFNKLIPAFTETGKTEKHGTEERYRYLQEIENAIVWGLKKNNLDINEPETPKFIKKYLYSHYPQIETGFVDEIVDDLEKTPAAKTIAGGVAPQVNPPGSLGINAGSKRNLRKSIADAHKAHAIKPFQTTTGTYMPPPRTAPPAPSSSPHIPYTPNPVAPAPKASPKPVATATNAAPSKKSAVKKGTFTSGTKKVASKKPTTVKVAKAPSSKKASAVKVTKSTPNPVAPAPKASPKPVATATNVKPSKKSSKKGLLTTKPKGGVKKKVPDTELVDKETPKSETDSQPLVKLKDKFSKREDYLKASGSIGKLITLTDLIKKKQENNEEIPKHLKDTYNTVKNDWEHYKKIYSPAVIQKLKQEIEDEKANKEYVTQPDGTRLVKKKESSE